jgi:lysophospholipase L1-like esterase
MTKPVILMLGDSLTQFWHWDELSDKLAVANHGRAGDTTEDLFTRLKMALSLSPKAIFLQVGINNLSQGDTPEKILEGHLRIWNELASQAPSAKLFVCSLMPVREDFFGWLSQTLTNERVRITNTLIKQAAEQRRLPFIDLYTPAADEDSELPEYMTLDGVHLTAAAYKVWLATLKPYTESLEAEFAAPKS